jgi:hypothetical protein
MAEHKSLVSGGWARVAHNKRYIVWLYILNLTLAVLGGAAAFSNQAHDYLDRSLHADGLVRGMDIGVLVEMFMQPEFGTTHPARAAGVHLALAFFLLTALFMPGVLQGYASTYRLPREDFFRACGRNLWRFIRLMIIAGILMGAVAVALFSLQGSLVKAAEESTNEILPFEVRVLCLLVIFLVMTALRIWFDLAEADVVLSDQNAVRKSIVSGLRNTWHSLGRLLGSYVLTTIVALIVLCAGLWAWEKLVPSASVLGAFVITQLMLLLLLIPRFWQRGVAVSYYLQNMVAPIAVQTPTPMVGSSTSAPVSPIPPPEPEAS